MRNQTPLVPGRAAFDATVYIVLNDFGPLGHAYCEMTKLTPTKRQLSKTF